MSDKKPVYVIGHKNPDTDSILSAKLISDILKINKIPAVYAIFEDDIISKKEMGMISSVLQFNPCILNRKNVEDKTFFLADHHTPDQSVGKNAHILGSIDHHPKTEEMPYPCLTKPLCSTSLVLYEEYKDTIPFSIEQKEQIAMAAISDSKFGKSSRYTEKDRILLDSLHVSIDMEQAMRQYFIPSDFSDKTILTESEKLITINNKEYKTNIIEDISFQNLFKYKEAIEKSDYKDFIGIFCNLQEEISFVILKQENQTDIKRYEGIISRKDVIEELSHTKKMEEVEIVR